ncbi:MAG: Ppx/GppA family phosphatase [Brevinematales bacterium]|nr:Ppx/GppA family phosphatase [Brevinematales bacterium]
MNIASIDLGSNSFHMVILELKKGHITILDRQKEKLRLASKKNLVYINEKSYITDNAIVKILDIMQKFKVVAGLYNAKIIAVATSAIREAENSNEIVQRIFKETGIKVDVISPYEEGRLAYLGAVYSLDCYEKDVTVIDIGGGSIQIVRGKKGNIRKIKSFRMGVIRLTEEFFEEGYSKSKAKELIDYIESQFEPIQAYFSSAENFIGVSGTIENIARLCNKISRNMNSNGLVITYEGITELFDSIPDIIKDENTFNYVDSSRRDTILAGIVLLKCMFDFFDIKRLNVSYYGIREGNAISLMKKEYLSNVRYSSTKHILKRFNLDKIHSRNVCNFALRIFDVLKNVHNLDKNWKDYLFTASVLHDVGKIISFNNHEDHSEYIISHSQILGYTEREKKIISKIAKYHKNQDIGDENNEVKILSGILRIADSLDKSGFSLFKDIKFDSYNRKLTIYLQKGKLVNVFNYYIEQKKKLLVQTLKIKIEVTVLD